MHQALPVFRVQRWKAGEESGDEATSNPRQSGATIFQNYVFHGCSVIPQGLPQSSLPPQSLANPAAEFCEQFNMSMEVVNPLLTVTEWIVVNFFPL